MSKWYLTIIDPARNTVLFAGNSEDETEIRAVASEARRLRPQAQIFIEPPMGQPLTLQPSSEPTSRKGVLTYSSKHQPNAGRFIAERSG